MKVSKYIVVPALLAVALFAVSTANAEVAKNGDGEVVLVAGGEGEGTKNGGSDGEQAENGGGDGENTKNGGDVTPPAPPPVASPPAGGGGGDGKNGGGKIHQNKRGGGGVGSLHVRQKAQVVCVIDGQIVYVRRVQDCTYHPQPVVQYTPRKHKRSAKKLRAVVQHVDKNGGDYVVMQQPQVQYYSPASPAATMQARKRAAKAAASYGYGDGYYVQPQVMVKQYRKKRKVRYAQPIYLPAPDYSGVVIHYGPLVTKGGAN